MSAKHAPHHHGTAYTRAAGPARCGHDHDHDHGHGHGHEHHAAPGHDDGPAPAASHGHEHAHGHHHHHTASRWLPLALALTLGFAAVEALAGLWSGSLALLGDAGHMVTDAMALGLAALAARIALRPASTRHSFGLPRVEALAALANSLFMLALVAALLWQAAARLAAPRDISGETVTLVALAGLALNLAVAWLLTRGEGDLNTRGALLHVLGDLLGSVAALASGLVIQFTGWVTIDPLLTMLICGLILASTLSLLKQVVHTLLEGVPDHLSLPEVGQAMAQVEGVRSVHDLHIWSLDSRQAALSAHVVLGDSSTWPAVLARQQRLLSERFGIGHVTLQPELPATVPLVFSPRNSTPPSDRP
ncbi:putative cobalt-zinc-cadmium resistance protein [Azoarcus olearius]|uniref:cation diffusion facilitator family transporter n=1 Tax=Azoarcus sp. (strain BH72) TaxID=418699 RepID=UPI00080608F1|nr:cation diffusion facilitator family transporter [Azoarcus olearius]ANQ84586.1 putative cobalt-zinc-cadmium resistance protein [Azoarcus olearius]